MIHTAELAKAVARTEQARQKKAEVLAMIKVTRCQARCYEKKDTSDRNKLLTFE